MAQFSLPQNSKVEVGNYFKDKTNSKNLRKINVYTEGKSNDAAAIKAIIWLILIKGFFKRSSPHSPQIKVPFWDLF